MPGHRSEPKVFFPWERRHGFRSLFMRSRARQAVAVACGVAGFVALARLERRAAAVRATRAEITSTIGAIAAWRADHDANGRRACPASPAALVAGGYLPELPRDAWGRVLRVTCPGRVDPAGFDVTSDGPDGEPGGLDRVQ